MIAAAFGLKVTQYTLTVTIDMNFSFRLETVSLAVIQSYSTERSTKSLGSFLIPPASVHSYTPTLKLIGSLFILSSKSETQKLTDQSER